MRTSYYIIMIGDTGQVRTKSWGYRTLDEVNSFCALTTFDTYEKAQAHLTGRLNWYNKFLAGLIEDSEPTKDFKSFKKLIKNDKYHCKIYDTDEKIEEFRQERIKYYNRLINSTKENIKEFEETNWVIKEIQLKII